MNEHTLYELEDDKLALYLESLDYSEELENYLKMLGVEDKAAQEIVHEVFARFYEALYRKEADMENIKIYLINAVRQHAVSHMEESRKVVSFQKYLSGKAKHSVKYLDRLSLLKREIIILKYYNELDFKEIARLLQMNVESVKAHFNMALNELIAFETGA
jgi:DNA-directed RNA polymerase specialized sigma24 family protein